MRALIASLALGCTLATPAAAAPPKTPKTVKRAKTVEDPKTIKRSKTKTVTRPKEDAALTPAQRKAWRTALNAAREAQRAGSLALAIRHFDAAIAVNPDDPRALGERGWAKYKQGDLAGAQADLMLALARTGDLDLRGSQLYNLGRVHEAASRVDQAVMSYRASLAARPHPAVRKRLEALLKAPVTPLDIQAAKPVGRLAALCAEADDVPDDDRAPRCTLSKPVATLGSVPVRTYTIEEHLGQVTTHLIFDLPGGKRAVAKGVHYEYNPGAFGISEETEFLRISADEGVLHVHARKARHDSDMGLNEVEMETAETQAWCGLVGGAVHCTATLVTAYSGSRELMFEDMKDDDTEHALWSRKWALAVRLDGKTLRITNAGASLPKGSKALLGAHPLPW